MKPSVYLDCLAQTAARDGLEPSDLQAVALMETLTMERALGYAFCADYERFLAEAGCGEVYGGLARWLHLDITRDGNILDVSRRLAKEMAAATRRKHGKNTFPRDFLVIYDACDGDLFGFIPTDSSSYQPQVYAWNIEDLQLREVAPDFDAFLDYLSDCDEL